MDTMRFTLHDVATHESAASTAEAWGRSFFGPDAALDIELSAEPAAVIPRMPSGQPICWDVEVLIAREDAW